MSKVSDYLEELARKRNGGELRAGEEVVVYASCRYDKIINFIYLGIGESVSRATIAAELQDTENIELVQDGATGLGHKPFWSLLVKKEASKPQLVS
ncbi:MAG TPA: hypothetical protein PKD68_01095 [Candidatus Saccharibacteria bacterium]|nr:hypothetical protein [Candidatus Saccharibacteria bacterium]